MELDKTYLVAIDFDGTLWNGSRLVDDAVEFVRWLDSIGVERVLWTCREGRTLQKALDVLDEAGIAFRFVNQGNGKRPDSRKVNANLYVDDQANCGVDWDGVRSRVAKEVGLR